MCVCGIDCVFVLVCVHLFCTLNVCVYIYIRVLAFEIHNMFRVGTLRPVFVFVHSNV